jgi:crotonobetainyl-CoA:carnitine CoA-transferase CaiB-like acyl-CoA transferase
VTLIDSIRVVDLTGEIAGPYCSKLLADAGADVVKAEPVGGDRLRRWSASGSQLEESDGALFKYLNTSKRSIVGDLKGPELQGLLAQADLLIDDGRLSTADIRWIRDAFGNLCVVSITPFGRTGPWAQRPATEFVLQALCGSIGGRGTPHGEPFYAGGRLGEWIGGTVAAVVSLAALRGTRRRRRGEYVDLSVFECMCRFMGSSAALSASLGVPASPGPPRSLEIPSIEPTADDFIGFCTVTGEQFQSFLMLIERPDLLEDADLASFVGRQRGREEFLSIVRNWTMKRTAAEIEELAALMRIPVAPVGRPGTVEMLPQFVERGVFVPNPGGGFIQPRPPYRIDDSPSPRFRPAPRLGENQGRIGWTARNEVTTTPVEDDRLPLSGLRVIDLTAFWAGPFATLVLAALGAEVIKVESIQRPDGMRFQSAKPPTVGFWWEWGSVFLGNNLNKKGVTLDLTRPEGLNLILRLVAGADALIENFSPRVLDNFGLTWERVRATNPKAVMVRMPAFGLSGPWRDRTGFAQTMEQVSGMAWMTGFADGPPIIPRGPCDPFAGLHAAFALLAALEDRDRSGMGHLVESTMVEAALNVAAEMGIEYQAYKAVLSRSGNRGPVAAPQGLYPCAGDENWLALAIASDDQWTALKRYLGNPTWASRSDFDSRSGRRAAHDEIDEHLRAWFADSDIEASVKELTECGIPAARVVEPNRVLDNPQLRARRFIESFDHPIVGHHEVMGMPFRFSSDSGNWFRTASPTMGQHNREVFTGLLGLSETQLQELRETDIIGEYPRGT